MESLRFFSRFSVVAVVFPLLLIGCVSESDLIMVKRDLNSRMDVMNDRLSRVESKDDSDIKGEIENLRKRQVELHNSMEEIRENTQDITGSLESKVMRLQRGAHQSGETITGASSGDVESMRQEIAQLTARVNELERILGAGGKSSSSDKSGETAPKPVTV